MEGLTQTIINDSNDSNDSSDSNDSREDHKDELRKGSKVRQNELFNEEKKSVLQNNS